MIIALYIDKASVLWFARKIFSGTQKKNKQIFLAGLGVIVVFGIASTVISFAGCDFPNTLSEPNDACPLLVGDVWADMKQVSLNSKLTYAQRGRQTIIQVLHALTEVMLVALPTMFVLRNSIKMSSKITVIALFSFRLPNICFMAAYVVSYRSIINGASTPGVEPTAAATATAVWSQVLLGYSLASASVPCIRSFMTAFMPDAIYRVYDTQGGSYGGNSGAMQSNVGNNTRTKSMNRSAIRSPQDGTMTSRAYGDDDDDAASDASQRIMIERSVQVDVTVEDAKAKDASRRQEWFDVDKQPYYHR